MIKALHAMPTQSEPETAIVLRGGESYVCNLLPVSRLSHTEGSPNLYMTEALSL